MGPRLRNMKSQIVQVTSKTYRKCLTDIANVKTKIQYMQKNNRGQSTPYPAKSLSCIDELGGNACFSITAFRGSVAASFSTPRYAADRVSRSMEYLGHQPRTLEVHHLPTKSLTKVLGIYDRRL